MRVLRFVGVFWMVCLGSLTASAQKPHPSPECQDLYKRWKAAYDLSLVHLDNAPDSALFYADKASALYDSSCLKTVHFVMQQQVYGYVHVNGGDPQQALDKLEPTRPYLDTLSQKMLAGKTWLYFGMAYRMQSRLDESLNALRKAETLHLFSKNKAAVGHVWFQMGVTLGFAGTSPGTFELVSHYYQKAIDIFDKHQQPIEAANIRNNLSTVCYNFGKYEQAEKLTREALKVAEEIGSESGRMQCQYNLARIMAKTGRTRQAEKLAEEVLAYTRRLPGYEWLEPVEGVVEIRLANGEGRQALGLLDSLWKAAVETQQPTFQIRAAALYAKVWKQLGNTDQAYTWLDSLTHLKERHQKLDDFAKLQQFLLRDELAYQKEIRTLREHELADEKQIQRLLWVVLALVALLGGVATYFGWRMRRQNGQLRSQAQIISAQNQQLHNLNNTRQTFFSLIAHDLRGPISNFVMIPEIMRSYLVRQQTEAIHSLLNVAEESFQATHRLLESLLEWSLSQTGNIPYQPQQIGLEGAVARQQDLFAEALRTKNLRLHLHIPAGLSLWADAHCLETILRNLLSNAIKFSHPGGEVHLRAEVQGEQVEICLSDQGIGMDAGKLESLLQAGQSRRSQGTAGEKGAGIGLLLTAELVALNRGSLHFHSAIGEGTRACVRLPATSVL